MNLSYAVNADNVSNIVDLTKKRTVLDERRLCELREVASAAASEIMSLGGLDMSIYEILSLISDMLTLPISSVHENILSDFLPYIAGENRFLSALDRAVLCAFLRDELLYHGITLKETDFLPISDLSPTFAYVKNAFSDEAYDVFSQDFDDPRVRYVSTFKDAISLVSTGQITYCILPIEERGTRIATVSQLIFSSDLKIGSIIPVLGLDGMADVKYALVAKHFLIPDVMRDDDRYLELRMPQDGDTSLTELLTVADCYGIDIHRLNTLVLDTDDGRVTHYVAVLRTDGRDFVPLLTYLMLYTDEFTPIGIYKNIE